MHPKSLATALDHLRFSGAGAPVHPCSDRSLLQRFVQDKDDEAFATLVRRHGPRVLGVCQRILRHAQDAEDVFQATFLVLARKAPVLHWQEFVGGWLHEVASRLALEARSRRAARLAREGQLSEKETSARHTSAEMRDLCTILEEEMLRLPGQQRQVLLACYFEGLSRDQAARQLGWSLRTVERRLHQGRERLRLRLVRKGVTLPAALAAAGLTQGTASAVVPSSLVVTTVKTASQVLAGGSAAFGVSSEVAILAKEGITLTGKGVLSMTTTKVLVAALLVVSLGLFGAAIASRQNHTADPVPSATLPPAGALEKQQAKPELPAKQQKKPATDPPRKMTQAELQKLLLGDWILVRQEHDGKDLPADKIQGRGATFKPLPTGLHLQFLPKEPNHYGYFVSINAATEPYGINLTLVGDGAAPPPQHGVFAFQGQRLLIYVADELGQGVKPVKPKDFKTTPGSKTTVYEFERVPPLKKMTEAEFLKKLEGEWQFVGMERDGKYTAAGLTAIKGAVFKAANKIIKSNKGTFIQGHQLEFTTEPGKADESHNLWFTLHPDMEPPGIDVTVISARGFVPSPGIVTFQGLQEERLLLCWPDHKEAGEPAKRPTEFKTTPGSKTTVYEFERVQPPAKKMTGAELWKKLQGSWKMVRQVDAGTELQPEQFPNNGITFPPPSGKVSSPPIVQFDYLHSSDPNYTFKIHPDMEAWGIDVIRLAKEPISPPLPNKGIFAFQGDRLLLCLASDPSNEPATQQRPKEFKSLPGTKARYYEFERRPSAAEVDLKLLQGEWKLIAYETQEKLPLEKWAGSKLIIKDNHFAFAKEPWLQDCAITLDPTKSPKEITLQNLIPVAGKNPPHRGIYEIKGDTLRLCVHLWQPPRPTAFAIKAGDPFLLLTFQRVTGK